MNKITTAGAVLELVSPQALARDCTALGEVNVKITTAPEHGKISIAPGMVLSNYKPGDPPYLCNDHRTPATVVTYKAAASYAGPDSAVIQVFFPDGRAPMIRFNITVD